MLHAFLHGTALAGALAGAIGGVFMPGPLAVLEALWRRSAVGFVCGGVIAAFAAAPLASALGHPDYADGVALALGFWGLTFAFKVAEAIKAADLVAILKTITGRNA